MLNDFSVKKKPARKNLDKLAGFIYKYVMRGLGKSVGPQHSGRCESSAPLHFLFAGDFIMNKTKHPASKTGAMRAALGVPYVRQVPLEAVAAGATALEYGALKYAHRNWERGLPWQQMIDSLKRHIDDFERGHDRDDGPDGSDLPQVCMIMASAMMLSASVIRGIGEDDRMPAPDEHALSAKDCAKWMKKALDESRMKEEL